MATQREKTIEMIRRRAKGYSEDIEWQRQQEAIKTEASNASSQGIMSEYNKAVGNSIKSNAVKTVQQLNALNGGSLSYSMQEKLYKDTKKALTNQYVKNVKDELEYQSAYKAYDYTNKSREEVNAQIEEFNTQLENATSDGQKRALEQQIKEAKSYSDSLMSLEDVNNRIAELEAEKETKMNTVLPQPSTSGIQNDEYKKQYDALQSEISAIDEELAHLKGSVKSSAYAKEDSELLGALSEEEYQALNDYYNAYNYITSEEGNMMPNVLSGKWARQNEKYNNAKDLLEGKYSKEEIERLSEAWEYTQNAQTRQDMQGELNNAVNNANGIGRAGLLVGDLGLSAMSTITSPIENVATLINGLTNDRPIDYNSPIYTMTNMHNDLSAALLEYHADSYAYQVAFSVLDSLASMGGSLIAGGGAENMVLFFMGNSAGANAALDVAQKGGSNEQILASALGAGICEVLFEKVSLGYFFKEEELMKAVMASEKGLPQLKSLAKSVIVSMGVNISEEVCTDIANEIKDRMINGELSEYSLRLAEYLKEGYSEKEAKRRCAIDFGKQLGNTVISSGIMGLALSGSNYAKSTNYVNKSTALLNEVYNIPKEEARSRIVEHVLSGESKAETEMLIRNAQIVKALKEQNKQSSNFMQSAQRAGIDIQNESIKDLNTLFHDRGINATTEDIFNDNSIAGIWTSEEKDGRIQRSVVLNPNATTTQWVQNIAIHELWHDMSNSDTSVEITKLIKEYNQTKADYESAYKALEREYAKMYDTESAEFKALIEEEATASVLGKKLGTQEFVNEIVQTKPTTANKIYNWVVDKLNKLNKLTGYKSEKLFWQDIENKFKTAYAEDYQGGEAKTKFSLIGTRNDGIEVYETNDNVKNYLGKNEKTNLRG